MKRLLLTGLLFFVLVAMWQAPFFIAAYRSISGGRATGVGFVMGSPAENLFRILMVVVLAFLAYWISGKLVRV
jgi:threonine/homoserine/homoserine lactone efflux protein